MLSMFGRKRQHLIVVVCVWLQFLRECHFETKTSVIHLHIVLGRKTITFVTIYRCRWEQLEKIHHYLNRKHSKSMLITASAIGDKKKRADRL